MGADVGRSRFSIGLVLLIVSVNLWLVTMVWFRLPNTLFEAQGQLYALWPIAVLCGLGAVLLAIAGVATAIVEKIRRIIGPHQLITAVLVAVFMIVLSPVLLWFGTIPI